MPSDAFHLSLPENRLTSVVFASPHSGRSYSKAFLDASVLDGRAIRSSEDAFVDQLLDSVPALGAPLLAAIAPRAFVDLNRGADELDPAVIAGAQCFAHNPRVISGLGVIPRVVSGGQAIYNGKVPLAEAHLRIRDWWHPYHNQLQGLLDECRKLFGEAILIDVHSMPHEAMEAVTSRSGRRPQIVIGDRYGAAAANHIVNRVEEAFRARGLVVARNVPFAGAYIAQAYGRPGINQHAIQIEMDRALYMDEAKVRPNADFAAFKLLLGQILSDIVDIGRNQTSLAAE
jgi:N-formylglutamate deformylase